MKTLVLGSALLLAGTGCLHFEPVGPLANKLGGGPRPAVDAPPTVVAPGVKVTEARDAAAAPLLLPAALPPPAPAALVRPADVTEANHEQAARRLADEMEVDRKAMADMPRYPEVSRPRN